MAPTFLQVKAQVLPMTHRDLHDRPCPLPILPTSFSPPYSLGSSHTGSSLFLQHTRQSRDPGPLQGLFPRSLHSSLPPSPPSVLCSNVTFSVKPPLTTLFPRNPPLCPGPPRPRPQPPAPFTARAVSCKPGSRCLGVKAVPRRVSFLLSKLNLRFGVPCISLHDVRGFL